MDNTQDAYPAREHKDELKDALLDLLDDDFGTIQHLYESIPQAGQDHELKKSIRAIFHLKNQIYDSILLLKKGTTTAIDLADISHSYINILQGTKPSEAEKVSPSYDPNNFMEGLTSVAQRIFYMGKIILEDDEIIRLPDASQEEKHQEFMEMQTACYLDYNYADICMAKELEAIEHLEMYMREFVNIAEIDDIDSTNSLSTNCDLGGVEFFADVLAL